ncbi:hypothetical protein DY000_02012139 [Brassica cretica]|uniref:Uncharacterized protein n=1 Tax=Brassica cretica TaxID=69181 RepID=A0ABQ7CWQ2_BRACR|nr:hypothetical protein DY000_02012139 [Brassica cretica]
MWVAHLDRLPTRSRLHRWGVLIIHCVVCVFWLQKIEISENMWDMVLKRLGFNNLGFITWIAFSDWLALKDSIVPQFSSGLLHKLPSMEFGRSGTSAYTTSFQLFHPRSSK